jgi:hypothetical protein
MVIKQIIFIISLVKINKIIKKHVKIEYYIIDKSIIIANNND